MASARAKKRSVIKKSKHVMEALLRLLRRPKRLFSRAQRPSRAKSVNLSGRKRVGRRP